MLVAPGKIRSRNWWSQSPAMNSQFGNLAKHSANSWYHSVSVFESIDKLVSFLIKRINLYFNDSSNLDSHLIFYQKIQKLLIDRLSNLLMHFYKQWTCHGTLRLYFQSVIYCFRSLRVTKKFLSNRATIVVSSIVFVLF